MKKTLSVLFAVALVLAFGTIAMAGSAPGTGIKGTYHDLSSLGRAATFGDATEQANDSEVHQNRICVYCHTPHNSRYPDPVGGVYTYVPLWNHAVTTSVFSMYSNGSDNGTLTGSHQSQAMLLANQPGSVSMLCLSCHDATVATNAYGVNNGVTNSSHNTDGTNHFVTARATIGGGQDLSNHHPIGFDYTQVMTPVDNEIRDISYVIPGAVAGGPQTIGELLWGGNGGNRMECVSCHDVHNTKNTGVKFTWINDEQSALCLVCHNKDNT